MPTDTVDFTSLTNFKKFIMHIDITAQPKCFPYAYVFFVYLILSCVTAWTVCGNVKLLNVLFL